MWRAKSKFPSYDSLGAGEVMFLPAGHLPVATLQSAFVS